MYIMMAFMGSALAGARAISHAFLSLSVSVSETEGGLWEGDLEVLVEGVVRWKKKKKGELDLFLFSM